MPTGDQRLRALVAGVVEQGDLAETGALEAKSSIDLTTTLGRAKIAKFILAMSNRQPLDAQRHFQGYAVMILGAAINEKPGIAPQAVVEAHELADALRPYLGLTQSRWDLTHVSSETGKNDVLIIVVDPPKPGDPPFPCCKDLQLEKPEQQHSLRDGAVYVRDKTSTRQAKSIELTALHERGRTAVAPQVEISVEFEGDAATLGDAPDVLEMWLTAGAERYRGERRKRNSQRDRSSSFLSAATSASMYGSVDAAMGIKSVDKVIADWESGTREDWVERMDRLAGSAGPPVMVTVANNASSYLPKPEMIILIADAYGVDDDRIDKLDEILKPIEEAPQTGFSLLALYSPRPSLIPVPKFPRHARWRNVLAGVEICLSPDSFRPQTAWRTEGLGVVIIAREPRASELSVNWRLTVEGVGEVYAGATTLIVDQRLGARAFIKHEMDRKV